MAPRWIIFSCNKKKRRSILMVLCSSVQGSVVLKSFELLLVRSFFMPYDLGPASVDINKVILNFVLVEMGRNSCNSWEMFTYQQPLNDTPILEYHHLQCGFHHELTTIDNVVFWGASGSFWIPGDLNDSSFASKKWKWQWSQLLSLVRPCGEDAPVWK